MLINYLAVTNIKNVPAKLEIDIGGESICMKITIIDIDMLK